MADLKQHELSDKSSGVIGCFSLVALDAGAAGIVDRICHCDRIPVATASIRTVSSAEHQSRRWRCFSTEVSHSNYVSNDL